MQQRGVSDAETGLERPDVSLPSAAVVDKVRRVNQYIEEWKTMEGRSLDEKAGCSEVRRRGGGA